MFNRKLAVTASLILGLISLALSAVPGRINFQGRLLDSSKLPRNGTFSMAFRICDSAAGDCSDGSGGQLWTETQSVSVSNGVFAVQLGASNAITASAFSSSTRYLEIIVAGETLSPRERLVAGAYSLRASLAEGLADNSLTADSQIAAGANISDSKLAAISSAGKVSGAALTSLSSIPSGAGLIPGANIDGSSVTKQGNTFNGNSQLVQLDGSGKLPALDGTALTGVGGSVVADTPLSGNGTSGSHLTIAASSVTMQANTFNGNNQLLKLSASGLVPNTNVDNSSVTKQGNTFNGVSQLVQLDGSGKLPALDGTALTGVGGSVVVDTPLTGNGTAGSHLGVAASSVTLQANTFNGNNQLLQLSGTGLVPNANVDNSSVTKMGNAFNAANKLLQLSASALVPNANVDNSSVTKMGNSFNGASQLLQLSAASLVPNANVDNSSVTKMGNAFNAANQLLQLNASADVPDANINASSVTLQGNTFNVANELVQSDGNNNISVGFTVYTRSNATSNANKRAGCGAGSTKMAISGGCVNAAAQTIYRSYPSTEDTGAEAAGTQVANAGTSAKSWTCVFSAANAGNIAFVICANVK